MSALSAEAVPPPPRRRPGPAQPGLPNPNLLRAPRCGARTRSGCPCQAPAVRDRRRCRMHGGRSTGPRTQEGLARLRAARTIHGNASAAALQEALHARIIVTRIGVLCEAVRLKAWLPPDMKARLLAGAAELNAPPDPAWGQPPFVRTPGVRGRAAMRAAARAEAAALAPWRAAIGAAKALRRAKRAQEAHATEQPAGQAFESAPEPHAPQRAGLPSAPAPGRAALIAALEAELHRRRGAPAEGDAQEGHAPGRTGAVTADSVPGAHASEKPGPRRARLAPDARRPDPGSALRTLRDHAAGTPGCPVDEFAPGPHATEPPEPGLPDFAPGPHATETTPAEAAAAGTPGCPVGDVAPEPYATEPPEVGLPDSPPGAHATETRPADAAAPEPRLNRAERRRLKALRRRWERRRGEHPA
jgi:hypothetical protein